MKSTSVGKMRKIIVFLLGTWTAHHLELLARHVIRSSSIDAQPTDTQPSFIIADSILNWKCKRFPFFWEILSNLRLKGNREWLFLFLSLSPTLQFSLSENLLKKVPPKDIFLIVTWLRVFTFFTGGYLLFVLWDVLRNSSVFQRCFIGQ